MKYLIIGGLSVFGEALINRLLKKEDTESVLVTKSLYQVAYERDGLEWINCDFKDSKEIFEVLFRTKPQAIFHLKVQDSVGQSWRNPNEAVDINIIETINILNAVRELDYRP